MYDEYLCQLEEAGKIRNLKERSISCYRNYVSYFLNYVKKDPSDLTCQDVLVLVYKCGQEKLNNLYYQMKEQRRVQHG